MTERLQIIHLGNAYDFVVKDHEKNRTYGTFQGDSKSLQECLNNLVDENEQLKNEIKMLKSTIARNEAYITRLTKKGKWTK